MGRIACGDSVPPLLLVFGHHSYYVRLVHLCFIFFRRRWQMQPRPQSAMVPPPSGWGVADRPRGLAVPTPAPASDKAPHESRDNQEQPDHASSDPTAKSEGFFRRLLGNDETRPSRGANGDGVRA